MIQLTANNLARYGMTRGAYNGANKRRFVFYETDIVNNEKVFIRREFDTKQERDAFACERLGAARHKESVHHAKAIAATLRTPHHV